MLTTVLGTVSWDEVPGYVCCAVHASYVRRKPGRENEVFKDPNILRHQKVTLLHLGAKIEVTTEMASIGKWEFEK